MKLNENKTFSQLPIAERERTFVINMNYLSFPVDCQLNIYSVSLFSSVHIQVNVKKSFTGISSRQIDGQDSFYGVFFSFNSKE